VATIDRHAVHEAIVIEQAVGRSAVFRLEEALQLLLRRSQQPAVVVLLSLVLVGAALAVAAGGVPLWAALVGVAILGSLGGAIFGARYRGR
jgi:membrane associated rhomboid family serine protease